MYTQLPKYDYNECDNCGDLRHNNTLIPKKLVILKRRKAVPGVWYLLCKRCTGEPKQ